MALLARLFLNLAPAQRLRRSLDERMNGVLPHAMLPQFELPGPEGDGFAGLRGDQRECCEHQRERLH